MIPIRKLLTGTSIALCAAVAAGCGGRAPAEAATPAASTSPMAIDVVRVTRQPLDVRLTLPGELHAYQTVDIHPRVSAFVRSISVDRGSHVRAGQVVAELDAPELSAQRAQAQSAAQAAEAKFRAARSKADADRNTFERLKAASATPGVVAGNEVALAERAAESSGSEMIAAEKAVEAARQFLTANSDMEAYLRVTAPFDGVVTARNVHPGALVGPAGGASSPIVTIAQLRRLRLIVPLPEAYTGQITSGATVAFSVAAYPGRSWTATVARIAESLDTVTRTMAVELDVNNSDGKLAPGAFCQVQWPVRRTEPSLFVPSGSVATTTGRTFVIRIKDGKAEWVDVKTGLSAGNLVEVFGALAEGDTVAARGTDELRAGTPVAGKAPKA